MSLNPDQKRAVTTTLRLLEERLARFEDLMLRPQGGILYHRNRAHFGRAREARIEATLADIRGAVRSLAEAFDLSREEEDPVRLIRGLVGISWEGMGEIDTRRLAGYGPVDPSLRTSLDPQIERLLELISILGETVGSTRDRPTLSSSDE